MRSYFRAPFTTPLLPDNALIFSRAFHLCFIPTIWEPGTGSFRSEMSNHSKLLKWLFAYTNPQSIAVIRLTHPEQSSRFCSLRETSFPVFLKCCPSSDPVTLNAQELPNAPGIQQNLEAKVTSAFAQLFLVSVRSLRVECNKRILIFSFRSLHFCYTLPQILVFNFLHSCCNY